MSDAIATVLNVYPEASIKICGCEDDCELAAVHVGSRMLSEWQDSEKEAWIAAAGAVCCEQAMSDLRKDYQAMNATGRTEADIALADAEEHIKQAARALSRIVVDECDGTEDYTDDFRDQLRRLMADLLATRTSRRRGTTCGVADPMRRKGNEPGSQ